MSRLTRGESKSLALHRAIADKLRADPALVAIPKRRLNWLRAMNPAGSAYHNQWASLLDGPVDSLIEAMVSPSERSCALRQENPFVDLVDQRERARIFREAAAAFDQAAKS